MRLPMKEEVIDIEQTKKMVDVFMSNGFTYYDTAYVYIGGKSEVAVKEAVVERYPRESFQVATKLPMWPIKEPADMQRIFDKSLERLGVDYVDYYLLHALSSDRIKDCDSLNAWGFISDKKAEGKIKNIGFSFHDTADVLDEVLSKHPELDFVQLQINYIDWESNDVQSRLCYEVAMKYNIPVIIMEPVKGGTLVELPKEAEAILKAKRADLSIPSWAIRYAASFNNVITVLSGMSNIAQIEDNVSYMKDFQPINEEENECIAKVVDYLNKIPTIPCTDCKYCVDGCPQNIDIPRLFNVMNKHKKFGSDENKPDNIRQYQNTVKDKGTASACIECGACEDKCPQKIEIINELSNIAKIYEI